jgi:hypothetical protein
VSRSHVYETRQKDPKFAEAWDQAREDAADSLEAEAVRRARAGSDTLLIFLLKAVRPEKYRETTRHEVSGRDGGPVVTSIVVEVPRGEAPDRTVDGEREGGAET